MTEHPDVTPTSVLELFAKLNRPLAYYEIPGAWAEDHQLVPPGQSAEDRWAALDRDLAVSVRRTVDTLHRGGQLVKLRRKYLREELGVECEYRPHGKYPSQWYYATPAMIEKLQQAVAKATPRLIVNAGDIWDIFEAMQNDIPFPLRLADGTKIEVSAGNPSTGEIGREHAGIDELRVTN